MSKAKNVNTFAFYLVLTLSSSFLFLITAVSFGLKEVNLWAVFTAGLTGLIGLLFGLIRMADLLMIWHSNENQHGLTFHKKPKTIGHELPSDLDDTSTVFSENSSEFLNKKYHFLHKRITKPHKDFPEDSPILIDKSN